MGHIMFAARNRSGRDRHRRTGGREPFVLALLLHELWKIVEPLPVKPVITLAVIGFQVGVHYFTDMAFDLIGINFANIQKYCLLPRKVYEGAYEALVGGGSRSLWQLFGLRQFGFPWARVLVSSVIHADDWHLYYNMVSYCVKGVQLEFAYGPELYIVLLAFSLFASHLIAVLLSKVMMEVAVSGNYYLDSGYDSCAVGFSAVIFCLKYVVNFGDASTTSMQLPIFGSFHRIPLINVPTKYACWVELVIISLVTPNASFIGHLAGILAGMLWVHGIDAHDRLTRLVKRLFRGREQTRTAYEPRPAPTPSSHQQERQHFANTGTSDADANLSQEEVRRRRAERYG